MKLQHTIWLATTGVIALIMTGDFLVSHRMIEHSVRTEIEHKAREVRAMLMATRRVYHQQFLDSGLPIDNATIGFLPAHALSRISADFFNWSKSGLYFNNVSDKPRNPGNLADAPELEAIAYFRANPEAVERVVDIAGSKGEPLLHYTAPIWTEPYCLKCHGERSQAPAAIASLYDSAFGYRADDLRGVMSIKLPITPLLEEQRADWTQGFLIRLTGYVLLLFLLGSLMDRLVSRRLARIEAAASRMGAGDYSGRITLEGRDELASLGRSFNAMAETIRQREQTLRQAEAAQRRERDFVDAVFETAGSLIVVLDRQGRIVRFNRAGENMVGYRLEEIKGRHFWDLFLLEPEAAAVKEIFEHIRAGDVVARYENHWRCKDGSARLFDWSNAALLDQRGEVEHIISVGIDITERKRAEDEIKALNAELEQRVRERTAQIEIANVALIRARDAAEAANRAKSAFLANMSHELRTPLNAILGFSDILRRAPGLSETQKKNLAIIHKSGDHLLGLINDVLDIAKIEAGRFALEPAPFDFGALITEVTEMLHGRARDKGLQFLVEPSSQFPRYIVGDKAKLRQILINLISNAIKATEAGSVTLRLGIKHDQAERLLMQVEDTGIGIAPADQARLFQPFVQIGSQSRQQGTGLGLAITRQFVELMQGSICLTSTVGQGSSFRVELPLQLARPEQIPQAPRERGEVIGLEPGQPACRVLVAEDQPDNRNLLLGLLESVGLEVRVAENGAQAVEQFAFWQPHFIWMDQRMPVLDGMEAARRIRALPGGEAVKMAAQTASSFEEDDAKLTAAGFDAIVHKPFRTGQIFDCMERLLGLRFARAGAGLPAPAIAAADVRVLIVDDDDDQRLLTGELLKESNFMLREAASGPEALRIFAEWRPQLILQDMHMPGMDGMETTRRIRALPGGDRTIVLALTAGALEEQHVQYIAAGCNAVVIKPVELEQVLALLAQRLAAPKPQ